MRGHHGGAHPWERGRGPAAPSPAALRSGAKVKPTGLARPPVPASRSARRAPRNAGMDTDTGGTLGDTPRGYLSFLGTE